MMPGRSRTTPSPSAGLNPTLTLAAMLSISQVFDAGLIKNRTLGFCWQPPQKDANCSAPLAFNSAVVFGPARPKALKSAVLSVAPL